MTENSTGELEVMRSQWTELYTKTLPALARVRDPAQYKWPVTLDHCFARIILDNTVGRGVLQWDNVVQRPAVKNMDATQLKEAIELGEKIKDGEVILVELDQQSLRIRGKGEKKHKPTQTDTKSTGVKHDRDDDTKEDETEGRRPSKQRKESHDTKRQGTLAFTKSNAAVTEPDQSAPPTDPNPNLQHLLFQISSHPTLTPFRKRLYSTLLSVPAGQYTTYASMAAHLSSAARAVGNGMRNNPFAPDVPCHRVLAADGTIGGFGGDWGVDGKHASKKRELLAQEGVKFDSRGKVKGRVFGGLKDMRDVNGEVKV